MATSGSQIKFMRFFQYKCECQRALLPQCRAKHLKLLPLLPVTVIVRTVSIPLLYKTLLLMYTITLPLIVDPLFAKKGLSFFTYMSEKIFHGLELVHFNGTNSGRVQTGHIWFT